MTGIHGHSLPELRADYAPLSPLSFLMRTVVSHPHHRAIVHGVKGKVIERTWLQLHARCCSLACALAQEGVGKGDVVAVMLPNTPTMVEASFAIPMIGSVACVLNPALEPAVLASMLDDSGAKVVMVDAEYAEVARMAINLRVNDNPVFVVDVVDPVYEGAANPIGDIGYEEFLAQGAPSYTWKFPDDEHEAIALCYSHDSDNTGASLESYRCSHRAAAISALAVILDWDMARHVSYLWTQPMFESNGWSLPWAVAARAGTNICVRHIPTGRVSDLVKTHEATHYCGPASVHAAMLGVFPARRRADASNLHGLIAGDQPDPEVIHGLERHGIALTHAVCLPRACGLAVRVGAE